MKRYLNDSVGRIETTIGELVAALTDVAQEMVTSESQEGSAKECNRNVEAEEWRSYEIAAQTLGQILHKNEIYVDLSN